MSAAHTPVWPDKLMLRDTGLHDDLGGLGQRIYTTTGAGYERREYVRADLAASAPELLEALRELHEAHCAMFPPSEAGMEAQTAWAERRAAAHDKALAAIAKATGSAA